MRVLLVTHYYPAHAGGIEIVAGALACRLARTHDITWAASDCNPPPAGDCGVTPLPMRTWNVVERITGFPFPLWGPGSIWRLWRAVQAADIVHLHDVIYFGNWAAFVFARLQSKPVLVTQHAGLIRYRSAVLRLALRLLHRGVARSFLQRATHVVFVSPVVRAYFQQFVRFRDEPEIVWNGVDVDLYSPGSARERAAAREQLGLPPDAAVVLFVGRFVEAKGLPVIRRLASALPDVTWVLAGWGPIDPHTWRAANVRVFRSLRGPTLVPAYRAADLLVLPSRGEGLPLVVQESLACGTPGLVDSDTAAAVDAPPYAVSGCAVADDSSTAVAWTAATRARLADRNTNESNRPAIALFTRQRWSWTAAEMRYSQLFELLSGPAPPQLSPDR